MPIYVILFWSFKTGSNLIIKSSALFFPIFCLSTDEIWIALSCIICDPPQEFDAKGESTRTTRLHDTLSVPQITDMRILN